MFHQILISVEDSPMAAIGVEFALSKFTSLLCGVVK